MNEDALRALVREAVARQLAPGARPRPDERALAFSAHASHFRYALPESDGPCPLEPAVACTHCGFCQSHGH